MTDGEKRKSEFDATFLQSVFSEDGNQLTARLNPLQWGSISGTFSYFWGYLLWYFIPNT